MFVIVVDIVYVHSSNKIYLLCAIILAACVSMHTL